MKYLLAVSGGIDSIVLLDMLARRGKTGLTVAHFDHGIRPDSAADARFVEALARRYGLPFITKREELGTKASEDKARKRRYLFLHEEADKRDATIVTAHHADDIVETMAINILRGTGWRGTAALDGTGITRPLLGITKQEIRAYALAKRLEWVEDSTNASMDYLRNRVRGQLARQLTNSQKRQLLEIWKRQRALKVAIDREVEPYIQKNKEYKRYFFIQLESKTATEILRAVIVAAGGKSPTRPQLERALLAVKAARAGAMFEIGDKTMLRFTTDKFVVQTP